MSRLPKFLLIFVLLAFVLACNMVTQPIKDVQDVAGTAESVASSMPIETFQALATNMPELASTIEAAGTSLPDIDQMVDPQGTPATEWNAIPIMSQATVGQEFPDTNSYSFKANVTVQEVQDYYNTELVKLGWSSTFSLPADEKGTALVFTKNDDFLTIAISASDDEVLVILTLA